MEGYSQVYTTYLRSLTRMRLHQQTQNTLDSMDYFGLLSTSLLCWLELMFPFFHQKTPQDVADERGHRSIAEFLVGAGMSDVRV